MLANKCNFLISKTNKKIHFFNFKYIFPTINIIDINKILPHLLENIYLSFHN